MDGEPLHDGQDKGLDAQGHIRREGALRLVPGVFRPVVDAARERLSDVFGTRMTGAYLYGSIPRGTARVGRSDLDLLVALREEPTEADHDDVSALGEALDEEFRQIDGVGTLLVSRARLLSELETYDLGWFVACLCTPLTGEDITGYLPRYRPDSRLARELTNPGNVTRRQRLQQRELRKGQRAVV
jgi:predicted nucleotidyltransferase